MPPKQKKVKSHLPTDTTWQTAKGQLQKGCQSLKIMVACLGSQRIVAIYELEVRLEAPSDLITCLCHLVSWTFSITLSGGCTFQCYFAVLLFHGVSLPCCSPQNQLAGGNSCDLDGSLAVIDPQDTDGYLIQEWSLKGVIDHLWHNDLHLETPSAPKQENWPATCNSDLTKLAQLCYMFFPVNWCAVQCHYLILKIE